MENKLPEVFLQLEYASCTLEQIMQAGLKYSDNSIKKIISKLIASLSEFHNNGIILQNISPATIFLVEDEQNHQFIYKFFDFSDAKITNNLSFFLKTGNTSPSIDIQTNQNSLDSYSADIFSLGLVLLSLLGFENPKEKLKEEVLYNEDFVNNHQELHKILKTMLNKGNGIDENFLKEFRIEEENNNTYEEEKKFCFIVNELNEKKMITTQEDLKFLYYKHKEMADVFKKANKRIEEQRSLEKSYEYLKEIKNKYQNHDLMGKTLLDEREEVLCLQSMSELYLSLGNSEKSLALLQDSIKVLESLSLLSTDNENYSDIYGSILLSLSLTYSEALRANDAEECALNSLNIFLRSDSENEEKLAKVYETLGIIYENSENFEKSEENYIKCLEKLLFKFGENHLLTASIYDRLANLSFIKEDSEKAEIFYKKTLEIREKVLGEHKMTGNSYKNLGNLYKQMWLFERSEENLLKSANIFRNLFGEKSKEVEDLNETLIELYGIIAHIKKKNNELKEAEENYNKALVLAKTKNSLYSMFLTQDLNNLYQKEEETIIDQHYKI